MAGSQKQLTVKLRLNATQFDSQINKINNKLNTMSHQSMRAAQTVDDIITAINKATNKSTKFTRKMDEMGKKFLSTGKSANVLKNGLNAIGRVIDHFRNKPITIGQGIEQATNRWWKAQSKVVNSIRTTNNLLRNTLSRLKAIAATYLGVMGTRTLINTTDTITSAENKLNYVSATQLGRAGYNSNGSYSNKVYETTADAMDKMYASSQKVRIGYTDMMTNVSKMMSLAGDSFDGNIDAAIRFQEIMAEAYAVGGASASEMSTSMYQLVQALGSGTLAGDELRSVREGAPLAYKAIEEFVQGVYNTEESLKELASQGKVTSDMVVAAIMKQGDALDKAFSQTEQTFTQTWTQIKNAAMKAFEPVAHMLRDALNEAVDSGLIEKIEQGFVTISKVLQITFTALGNIINWIVTNWHWIEDIVIPGILTLAVIMVTSALISAAAWVIANWQLILIALSIFIIIWALYAWQQGIISVGEVVLIISALIIAALVIVALAFGWTWLLWAALIVGALAIAFYFFEQVCGGAMWLAYVIMDILIILLNIVIFVINLALGIILFCLATIYNTAVGVANGIIELVYALIDPIVGVIEFILNCCNGGFNDFGSACANLIGQIISWFLSLGKVVTTIIDAIFGTNWTSGLNSLQNSVLSWGKNEQAITIKRDGASKLPRISATNAFSTGFNAIGYVDLLNPMEGYNTGAEWGAGVKDKANNLLGDSGISNFISGLSNGSIWDNIGKDLGLDFSGLDGGLPSVKDPAKNVADAYKQPNPDDLLSGVDKIADDTGSIKDSVELADEDLEYLRKIAEMEWKKEYTTASITVDMSNYNTINGESDLDGIVTKLADKLYEEMNVVANGVYA